MIQGVWIFLMVSIFRILFFCLTSIPTLIAIVLMRSNSGTSKVKFQKIAKCLLIYTLVRSFVYIIDFVSLSLLQLGGWRTSLETFTILGINMMVELVTAYSTLQVLRLTNQYLFWINRKIARGITEDDLQYNC